VYSPIAPVSEYPIILNSPEFIHPTFSAVNEIVAQLNKNYHRKWHLSAKIRITSTINIYEEINKMDI
jgi:hypothetical protein